MSTAGFLTGRSTAGDGERHLQHLASTVGIRQFGVRTGLILHGNLEGLLVELFEFFHSAVHNIAAAEDADLARHQFLHAGTDLRHVFRAGILQVAVEFVLRLRSPFVNEGRRDVDAVFRLFAEVGDEFAHDHTGHNGFRHGVTAQAVKAVHIPARSFAGSKKALERTGLACVVGANTAHGVVHSRTDRNPFLRRVNAEEVVADFIHFTQIVLDVVFA